MDELHLGSQDNLPEDVLQNKAKRLFSSIPLGLIGLMYHAIKTEKFLCTIDFILIHRYCIENLSK
jgi:hypothetical protein